MRKVLCCVAGLSLFTAASAFASGYSVFPVQSYNSVGTAGAGIAMASGADAVFYNPAAASWIKDGWLMQIDLNYIHMGSVEYNDNRTAAFNGTSTEGNFLIPTIFVLSPAWKDFRFGFSVTSPYGLTMRWEDGYPSMFSHKFALQMTDINPTATYAVNDKFSIAAGVRMVYATATVINQVDRSMGPAAFGMDADGSRYMNGSDIGWGCNLAANYRPTKDLSFAVTYRSKTEVEYTGEGVLRGQVYNAALPGGYLFGNPYGPYPNVPSEFRTRGSVTAPEPASLAVSGAYTFGKTTLELTIAETFWSSMKSVQFNMEGLPTGNPVLDGIGAEGKITDWRDTISVHLGAEYAATRELTLMAGIAYDQTPVPDSTLGFELPDSDAVMFSIGARYAFTKNIEAGMGLMYNTHMHRSANNAQFDGSVSSMDIIVVSAGVQYRF